MRKSATPGRKPATLPELAPIDEVRDRLGRVFPADFPDRGVLVGLMATRAVFVFLYGGFVEGAGRYLRPSFVYFFTEEQSVRMTEEDRTEWLRRAGLAKFRPQGTRWYADNSRESIRDDLLRNAMLRLGLVGKRSGVAVTSSKPSWYLAASFARLFDPGLGGVELDQAIETWRSGALDPGTLQRMALRAQGVERRDDELLVELPDGSRIRVAHGPSSLITKDLIEVLAPKFLGRPAVLWISASDRKAYPQFVELAASVGLRFDLNAELPDLILADLSTPIRFICCEVVATDGPVSEARKQALVGLMTAKSKISTSSLTFVTAYEDRNAAPFKKNFSQLARDSFVWFRTEPDLLVHLSTLRPAK